MKCPVCVFVAGLAATHCIAGQVASVDAHGYVAFASIDSDRNGYVSRVEARSISAVENAFDAVDANGDGLLDREEYTAVRPKRDDH